MDPTNAGERILIVDDDEGIRSLVECILKRERFQVDSARDGFEAIQKLAGNDYGTILLDLMMPRVDGHGVLQYLENEHEALKPCVIIMTANIPSAIQTRNARPVFRVLPKPFDISQLIHDVRECAGLASKSAGLP